MSAKPMAEKDAANIYKKAQAEIDEMRRAEAVVAEKRLRSLIDNPDETVRREDAAYLESLAGIAPVSGSKIKPIAHQQLANFAALTPGK